MKNMKTEAKMNKNNNTQNRGHTMFPMIDAAAEAGAAMGIQPELGCEPGRIHRKTWTKANAKRKTVTIPVVVRVDVSVNKIRFNPGDIAVVKFPKEKSRLHMQEVAQGIHKVLRCAIPHGNIPVVAVRRPGDIAKLSDMQLSEMGLMRIPATMKAGGA